MFTPKSRSFLVWLANSSGEVLKTVFPSTSSGRPALGWMMIGLSVLLGDLFSGENEKTHALRLGYANLNEAEFEQALNCLSIAVSKQCQ